MGWRNYSDDEVARLATPPTFIEDQSERHCPACDNITVRQYMYRSKRRTQPSIVGYAWCRSCNHYVGSTGPELSRLVFDDPLDGLTADERVEIEADLHAFFGRLDRLWEEGSLPQEFGT